jgi:CDP-glucose 4,6-dehydratase
LAIAQQSGKNVKGAMEDLVKALASLGSKNILVTGHTGFKGSWLVEWLLKYGARITGIALEPQTSPSHFHQLRHVDQIVHHIIDVRDADQVFKVFDQAQPQVVFHLAAQALVRKSYRDPRETMDINVGGGINVLEAVRNTESVEALVFVTSDKCYLNKELTRGYVETDELGGVDPYSASKAAAEIAFAAYASSFFADRPGFAAASARAGNVVGGGDWSEDRIVPDCMRSLMSDQPISLRRPQATRPWQHVLEPLSGYITLAHSLLTSPSIARGAWNFGPPEDSVHSVLDVVNSCVKNWGSETVIHSHHSDVHEAGLLQLNCQKAHDLLHWSPRWDFERTVSETTEWYQRTSLGEEPRTVTLEQITRYEESQA